jgi:5'-nucleotidase
VSTLDFGDPVDALNRVTGQLSDGNDANGEADVLVALVHEGAGAGTPDGATLDEEVAAGGAFADIVTGTDARVDAILTGHTHKEYAWEAPVPGEDGATRPVIQTGSYGENLGHTSLSIDPDTFEVVAHEAENVKRGAAPTEQEIAASPALTRVDDIVTQALAHADEIGSQPVGSVTKDITTAFGGGSFADGTWTGGTRDDRASESALGNLVADALRDSGKLAELGGADIGIVNPGGLRNELYYAKSGGEDEDGVVTFAEANAVLPFVNNVWTVELTGAQLKEVLEEQWQTDADGNRPSRPYLALGLSDNVTWVAKTADPNAAPGGNVLAVYVDGTLVRDDDTFTVSTFSFLAQGGDNFRTLAQGTSRDTGLIDRDVWMDYLGANSPVAPSFARSRVVAGALPGTVDAGKQASVTLSGFDLTSLGSPLNTTVSARLVPAGASAAGVSLGDFAIDEGAAAIAATIPAGTAAGEYTIVATAQPSGTAVRLPITVKAGSDQPGPDDPGTPGEDPVAPSAGDLTDGARGGITTDIAKVEQGGTIRVSVGVGHAGEKVNVWLHSDPVLLARSVVVPESGILTVTIPADTPAGAHKISVTAEDGTLLGWAPIEVLAVDTPGTTPPGSGGASPKAAAKSGTGLSDTGAEISWPLGLALLLTAVGGALVTTRRRSGSQER